jgi:hypothetical protein
MLRFFACGSGQLWFQQRRGLRGTVASYQNLPSMINTVLRLEFENVFPEENPLSALDYLKNISKKTLLEIIGFSNTKPQPNYDDFATNLQIRQDVTLRVTFYLQKYGIEEKPIFISREASLRLAEIILSNREILLNDHLNDDTDRDEINLFKAFLVINKEINSKQKLTTADESVEKLADLFITMSFPTADLGIFEDNDLEFAKVLWSTLNRLEMLLDFLKSKAEYDYLINDLINYFNLPNLNELIKQIKFLFGKLLELKINNRYKFKVDDSTISFIESLATDEIVEDADFTALKNHPIYRIEGNVFSIVDYFFVLDKFNKSLKFILKNSFNKKHNLPDNDRTFFSFFNTEFSEGFLMKKVLDSIFDKPYYVKKKIKNTEKNEPDYYVRHNNRIFVFENKDILIAKDIKSSANIDKINSVLKSKFLEVNGKPIGIGQLVRTITEIVENKFEFDDYVNSKKNLTIYPILVVNDRIFEILAVNYRLNNWYLASIKEKLGQKYNPNFIMNLTLIDIDTLLYWQPYFKENDNNLKQIIDLHLAKMRENRKVNIADQKNALKLINQNMAEKFSPISNRMNGYNFPIKLIIEKFEEIFH